MGKIVAAVALACMMCLVGLSSIDRAVATDPPTEEEIEEAIDKGLEWLASVMDPGGFWTYFNGVENTCYDIGTTGLVLLKFVERAVELELDPFDNDTGSPTYYEYSDNVIAAFDYLFGYAAESGDRVYIAPPCVYEVYSTGIVMMDIAVTHNPDRTISTGVLTGETYQYALNGMMNWTVYAQNIGEDTYPCDEGGWGYTPRQDGTSDQSNSGYATLGLGFAQAVTEFGLSIPQSVKDRLDVFIGNVQVQSGPYEGGSIYNPCWTGPDYINVLKTGNLMYELALVGYNESDERVQDAISFIETYYFNYGGTTDGCGWRGDYQAIFTMMKGFEAYGIETIEVSGSDIDWYENVSAYILEHQHADGWWASTHGFGVGLKNISTAWAMLTLERVVPEVRIHVYVDIKPGSCPNPINTKSNGVLPVAILGTDDFDVTTIDPASVRLTREGYNCSVAPLRWAYEDVATPFLGELCCCHDLNGDGIMDLTLKFKTQEVKMLITLPDDKGETFPLTIIGNLLEEFDGTAFYGQDCVWVLK